MATPQAARRDTGDAAGKAVHLDGGDTPEEAADVPGDTAAAAAGPPVGVPAGRYTVQLVATGSLDALHAFATDHQVEGASAARVERDGESHYVLLLGGYETAAAARGALNELPERWRAAGAWVRPLAPLRAAGPGTAGANRRGAEGATRATAGAAQGRAEAAPAQATGVLGISAGP
jgi:septal ring-binding cell division protein DamX